VIRSATAHPEKASRIETEIRLIDISARAISEISVFVAVHPRELQGFVTKVKESTREFSIKVIGSRGTGHS
jgi:hypothetical protein